jgi:hypothetical protein
MTKLPSLPLPYPTSEAPSCSQPHAIQCGHFPLIQSFLLQLQFPQFSIKEFLTLPHLATASGEVSNYHIDLEPAHTILAQACLGVLLQIRDGVEGCTPEDHLLARYAAEHWTTHAVWLTPYDIDTKPGGNAILF